MLLNLIVVAYAWKLVSSLGNINYFINLKPRCMIESIEHRDYKNSFLAILN